MRTQAAILLVLASGCSSDGDLAPCEGGNASVAVSDASAPVFTWSPSCGAASLIIRPGDGVGATWYIQTNGLQNTLQPGIVYGVVPAGAGTLEPPVPLVNGHEYQVSLLVSIEVEGGMLIREAGATIFVK